MCTAQRRTQTHAVWRDAGKHAGVAGPQPEAPPFATVRSVPQLGPPDTNDWHGPFTGTERVSVRAAVKIPRARLL